MKQPNSKEKEVPPVIDQYKDETTGATVTVYAPCDPEIRHECRPKGFYLWGHFRAYTPQEF